MEKVGCCLFKVHRGNQKKSRKSKSEFLIFAKLSAEKLSETACKVFGKKKQEQKKRESKLLVY